jgi:hypothetical protein
VGWKVQRIVRLGAGLGRAAEPTPSFRDAVAVLWDPREQPEPHGASRRVHGAVPRRGRAGRGPPLLVLVVVLHHLAHTEAKLLVEGLRIVVVDLRRGARAARQSQRRRVVRCRRGAGRRGVQGRGEAQGSGGVWPPSQREASRAEGQLWLERGGGAGAGLHVQVNLEAVGLPLARLEQLLEQLLPDA